MFDIAPVRKTIAHRIIILNCAFASNSEDECALYFMKIDWIIRKLWSVFYLFWIKWTLSLKSSPWVCFYFCHKNTENENYWLGSPDSESIHLNSVHSRPRPCANGAHFLAWAQRKFHTRVRRAHKICRRSEFWMAKADYKRRASEY